MSRACTRLRARCAWLFSILLLAGGLGTLRPAAATNTPRWVAVHFGSLDGMPVDSARGAALDADGFLWLATHDGLTRFDGESFLVYDAMRFPAMSGNRVIRVVQGPAKRVYALTEQGDMVSVRTGTVAPVLLDGKAAKEVRYLNGPSLCVTTPEAMYCPDDRGTYHRRAGFPDDVDAAVALPGAAGTIWLLDRGYNVWMYRRGQWYLMWRAPPLSNVEPPIDAVVDRQGTLWMLLRNRLHGVAPDGRHRLVPGSLGPELISRLYLDADGTVIVGADNGVFAWHGPAFETLFAAPHAFCEPGFASWRGADNSLWIACEDRLWRLPPGSRQGDTRRPTVLLVNGAVDNLFFGAHGSVWVLTLHDGIYRLTQARVDVLDAAHGLPGDNVYGITRDARGHVWLGTLGSGVIEVRADGSMRRYGVEDGLPGMHPWAVAGAPDGSLYAATYAPGLWRMPVDSGRFSAVAMPEALQGSTIRALVFDAHGDLWLATSSGAWRRHDGSWRKVWPAGNTRRRINSIAFGRNGAWMGGDGGVWFYADGGARPVAAALLSQVMVRNLQVTRDGALWISTEGQGLIRVAADDPQGAHALQLGRDRGLPSSSPHTVRQDAAGNLWVNSNQGIFRITQSGLAALLAGEVDSLSPLVLGLADGLSKLEGNGGVQPAALQDLQGRLWFPSQSGVVRFQPTSIEPHANAPRAVIAGLSSDGRSIVPQTDGSLPVGVRNVHIRFAAANPGGSGQTRFRYRLLPLAQGWSRAQGERSAVFGSLAPGAYRFEITAGNSDGVWAAKPTVLPFLVPPFWYETTLFRVGLLCLLLLAAAALVRWRLRSLQQQSAALDREVRQRTAELETEKQRVESTFAELSRAHHSLEGKNLQLAEQAERLQKLGRFRERLLADVSHELRTPLMLVSLPLAEVAEHAASLASADQQRIALARHQLGRVKGLVEQLVHLVQAESGQLSMAAKRVDLSRLLRRLLADYQPAAQKAGVNLTLTSAPESLPMLADPAHLLSIFGNLVDNAMKYAPEGSQVDLHVEADEEQACIEVRDHGPGFAPGAAEALFERFYRGEGPPRRGREGLGIGLSLVRELVGMHGGRVSAHPAPGAGAIFRVILPLGSEHLALADLALDGTSTAAAPVAPLAVGEGCLLLVEDHPDLAAWLGERLAQRVPTLCATSAEEARQWLAQRDDIRLVLSDVMLPGDSGVDLCRELDGHLPVILISAKAADRDRQAGLEAGAVAYLAKPFAFERLLQTIASAWPAVARRLTGHADALDEAPVPLRKALECIADPGFSMADWAERTHMSERTVRRKVKELTGMSPQLWLREQRLLRTRQLLASGECKTLVEAGAACGLDTPAYLYRIYRARFGDD